MILDVLVFCHTVTTHKTYSVAGRLLLLLLLVARPRLDYGFISSLSLVALLNRE